MASVGVSVSQCVAIPPPPPSLGRGPASLARLTRHCLYNADQARGCPEEEWHGEDSTIPLHEASSLQFKCMRVVLLSLLSWCRLLRCVVASLGPPSVLKECLAVATLAWASPRPQSRRHSGLSRCPDPPVTAWHRRAPQWHRGQHSRQRSASGQNSLSRPESGSCWPRQHVSRLPRPVSSVVEEKSWIVNIVYYSCNNLRPATALALTQPWIRNILSANNGISYNYQQHNS